MWRVRTTMKHTRQREADVCLLNISIEYKTNKQFWKTRKICLGIKQIYMFVKYLFKYKIKPISYRLFAYWIMQMLADRI